MKKRILPVAVAAVLCGSMMFQSCIGSFTLTNKLLSWNRSISNKFVNELVFFAFWVLPVYEVSGLADVLVLNSIEFWSGENPVAQDSRVIEGNDGRYLVESDANGYTITSETDGSVVRLDYHSDDSSWSITDAQGQTATLMKFVDDTHVMMPAADGSWTTVELSESGVMAYSDMVKAANERQLAMK